MKHRGPMSPTEPSRTKRTKDRPSRDASLDSERESDALHERRVAHEKERGLKTHQQGE